MDQTTVKQLNEINLKFYSNLSEQFSESRDYYWKGWERLLQEEPLKEKKRKIPLKVLDVGCGNGRFGKFIVE